LLPPTPQIDGYSIVSFDKMPKAVWEKDKSDKAPCRVALVRTDTERYYSCRLSDAKTTTDTEQVSIKRATEMAREQQKPLLTTNE
jgi:hypothetical protein